MKVYKKDILIFLRSHVLTCDFIIKNYYFDNDEEIVF